MSYPRVSVVIATSRSNSMYEESLKRQNYPNYEIIPIKGYKAAKARNLGIEKARGEIIAFIDDDVVLPQTWMSEGVKSLHESGADIVGGPNLIPPHASPGEKISNFLISNAILNGFRKKFKKTKKAGFSSYKDFATCNIMIRKGIFEKVGYFDEKYPYGEDMDFLLRCSIKGATFYYSPDCFLYHKRRSFPLAHMKQMFFWGRANMQLAINYPFVFKRVDLWGALIFFPVSLTMLYFYFKPVVIMSIFLLPIIVHFLSYSFGAITGLAIFSMGRK